MSLWKYLGWVCTGQAPRGEISINSSPSEEVGDAVMNFLLPVPPFKTTEVARKPWGGGLCSHLWTTTTLSGQIGFMHWSKGNTGTRPRWPICTKVYQNIWDQLIQKALNSSSKRWHLKCFKNVGDFRAGLNATLQLVGRHL